MKIKSEVKWSEVKGTFLKKKINKKVTYKDVVNETVICFFLSWRFGIQFGWRFVLKTTYKCQILLSATRVVDNITAIIFKNLKCERISEVKSTFSTVVLVLLFGVLVHAEIINDISHKPNILTQYLSADKTDVTRKCPETEEKWR